MVRDDTDGALVWTFGDLWDRLGAWAAITNRVSRDDLGARMLSAAVLADAGEGGSAVLPRLAPALDALRASLALADSAAAPIAEALHAVGGDEATGRRADVTRVMALTATVEARLEKSGVVDGAVARRLARDLLLAGQWPQALAAVSSVTLYHPVDLTPVDLAILGAIGARVPTRAILPVDDAPGRHAVVGADRVFAALERGAHIDVIGDGVVGEGPLAPFRAALFGTGTAIDAPASVVLAADVEEEARVVVGAVAELQHRVGHKLGRPARVAITARRPELLRPSLRALAREGIEVRRRRRTLNESPAAHLMTDFAALRTDGMPRDRLMAVLLNPARRGAITPDQAAQLLTTLRRAAARRDHEDTRRPVGGYRRRLEQLVRRDPSAADDVAFALATIEPVMRAAASLPIRGRLVAHLEAWLSLARQAVDDGHALGGEEVFEIIARMVAGARRVGDPPASIELLSLTRLVDDELGRQPWLDDDVDVSDAAPEALTLPECIGRQFDAVIVVGAVEGELPALGGPRSLLADVDRAHINHALGRRVLSVGDLDRDPHAVVGGDGGTEGLWWLTALRAAEEAIVIVAPRREARGRQTSASAFVLDAARVLGASPSALALKPSCGVPISPRRDHRHRHIAASIQNQDAIFHRAKTMSAQRRHFFAHPERTLAERRGPFAFAVDSARVQRAFGHAFGLSAARPLTPTRLESLAECRMFGFVQHVLKLDVDTEPGNAIEARVLGTFAHTVLERFYTERAKGGVPVDRFVDGDRGRLVAIIDEEITRARHTASGHADAVAAGLRFMRPTLVRVVASLSAAPPVVGVEPSDFELQIGAKAQGRDPDLASVPIDIGGGRRIFVGGIIDRVDEGAGRRAVVDYKTMSASRVREKAAPSTLFESHFQLLLYLRLLEHHRPTSPDTELHGYLLSLKDGAISGDVFRTEDLRGRLLDDERDDSLGRSIGRVILPILDGTVPPDAGVRCVDCRLQRVCRVPLEGAYDVDPDEVDDDGGGA